MILKYPPQHHKAKIKIIFLSIILEIWKIISKIKDLWHLSIKLKDLEG